VAECCRFSVECCDIWGQCKKPKNLILELGNLVTKPPKKNMNKEINPLVALGIIILFLLPISVLVWATGEQSNARVGAYYLEQDALGQLSLQADHLLVTQSDDSEQVFDLSRVGVSDLMGNVAYLSNNDFLVRGGGAEWGPVAYFSLRGAGDTESEKLRQALADNTAQEAPLIRCNRMTETCSAFHDFRAPWRYRLFIDHANNDDIYLTQNTLHSIKKFSVTGDRLGTYDNGLKFPKRLRRQQGELYTIDTNHHRLVFLKDENSVFAEFQTELYVAPDAIETEASAGTFNPAAKWTVDAVLFGNYWWAVNAGDDMIDEELHRFDLKGNFIDRVSLADEARPFDLLVWQGHLLVSDLARGVVYQFDESGNQLTELQSPAINTHFSEVREQHDYYQLIVNLTLGVLVLMFVGGLIVGLKVGRKHDKENPHGNSAQGDLPTYLSPTLALYKPTFEKQTFTLASSSTITREQNMDNILISNIEVVPGKRVSEHIGLVQGSTVRAKHAGKDILAGLKNIFGGELSSYTELLSESRQEAIDRMTAQAKSIGANAVINVRFSTSSIAAGASEILAYGTAVLLEDR